MKKKVIALVLVVALLVGLLAAFVGCNKDENNAVQKKDKAIIYVTALFSGGLYDSSTNEAVWEPFSTEFDVYDHMDAAGNLNVEELLEILSSCDYGTNEEGEAIDLITYVLQAIEYEQGNLLWDLTLDQDGNSNNPNIVPANNYPTDKNGNVMDISNGVFGVYKPFIEGIKEKYGNDYEVETFNYDWRYSPAEAGKKLEEYINYWGYKEVILMSHSMGGPTVGQYLARSQENRDKVKLYMGFAPATMGSYDALAALTCPAEYVNSFIENMGDSLQLDESVLNMVKNIVSTVFQPGGLGDFLFNHQGLITLVPSWQLYNSSQYGEDEYGIYIDGEPIKTEKELYDFYNSQSWAVYYNFEYDEDGNVISYEPATPTVGEYCNNEGYKVKTAVATLQEYYDSFYIDGEYVMEMVNSYYFVGTGLEATITGLNINTNGSDDPADYTYEIIKDYGNEIEGDGTVPYYASIGGYDTEDIRDYQSRIIKYDGRNHMDVGCSYDLLQENIMKLLNQTIGY